MDENNEKKRTTEAWEKLMSSFTDDLWIEILLRLPVKPLLRFKSVSKSWFSIISSHRFAKSHLMAAAKDDQVLIVHQEADDGSFALFHLGSERIFKNLKFPYSQGEYPSDDISSTLIGSDCGIVCVSVDLSYWPVAKKEFDIYLWNPATKHSKLIPSYTKPDDDRTSGALGFGFDHIDFDFKLVKVLSHNLSAKVYSSIRNDWQNIQPKPSDVPQGNSFDVCFHGFLFAIGRNSGMMMAFNLNKELFICDINLPGCSFDDAPGSIETRVSDFKDTITVIFFVVDDGEIQLWTLDDEACLHGGGVEALWTNVLSIDVGVPLLFVEGLFNNFQIFVVNRDKDRFMYDLNKKVTGPYFEFETGEIFKYTKSLFSLQGFKRIKWAASSLRLQDSSDSGCGNG
ncbi:F-box domain-containing protein [Heracleum sosnowskyi]|uniref:F-box domain-containing protein n=1 Tax=Heracleum sosnowskyi TaxID=360622 RepID=A0AAD8J8T7_9APIA|nr:F-box domain-containing protein [Heracleum sosnowskyi]